MKDHVKIPIFLEDRTMESYDNCFHYYLSSIAMEQLPQHRPLWEIHIVKYPTTDASGTVIFKLHHALGDGYSLMGALLSCLQRADDPSLPLSFPSLKPSNPESLSTETFWRRFSLIMSSALYTSSDFGWSVLKSSIINDDKTPIRSGDEGVEFHPFSITTLAFSMDHIKDIKSRLGVV
ncbi:O-acyltransferase, WSD1, N-terminal [Sesbania bispinosa]|nr:O-acyltransferase, WSD1, N-terminal [Sesbania bispinosa]